MIETISTLPIHWLIILLITAFVAGYVDSIAGGGGMIQLPILLLAGIPPTCALGTNKIVSMSGTSMAVIRYTAKKLMPVKFLLRRLIPALICSYLGAKLTIGVPDQATTIIILFCIPLAFIFMLKKRRKKQEIEERRANNPLAYTFVSLIGFYDGFVGPGTGAYLAIMASKLLGINYVKATAFAKGINLATNIAAVIAFTMAKKIIWTVALPMALFSILGAFAGTHFAIKNGEAYIKKVLIIVLVLLLAGNAIKLIIP